ncbi:uncharacterized protein PHALS_09027 [Plasmopara halstedii]|uniref:Uncharacterized protein n=1 Tax=Plasmopara halstedii TaxID=4781 RepID=A0A0P1AE34_PLAHL|nr:uncharacterized protein PHALS_09027 [Plasmopara halstedii]CEG38985.1 hypothetical protein PHALS_09027 [Plasmopara halstedii]|eukprot:XP_024575354.1 hypothetical protein PHALS_09027 [Plasmopara halstedii]
MLLNRVKHSKGVIHDYKFTLKTAEFRMLEKGIGIMKALVITDKNVASVHLNRFINALMVYIKKGNMNPVEALGFTKRCHWNYWSQNLQWG